MFPAGFATSGRAAGRAGGAARRPAAGAPFSQVERLDARLAELARGSGRARLVLGELLEALASRGGHHELGFSSLEAYARERAGRSGRWAVESRTLARRLAARPLLRGALASGALGWCMAELVARHATPDTEAELVARALRSTVREMRAHFSQAETERDADDTCTLTLSMSQRDAWLFAWTRRFADHVAGKLDADALVGALLAEAFNTLCGALPSNDVAVDAGADGELAWRAQLAEWRQESERRCEANFAERGPGGGHGVVSPLPPLGARALDTRIAALAAEFTAQEVELARTALAFHQAEGARRLGYSTEAQYARERLGLSASSFRAKLTLARRLLAPLRRALEHGKVGHEAALAISRVATADTAEGWLLRARERTVKHLLEDVRAAELVRGLGGPATPPTPETVRELHALEGRLLAGDRSVVLEAGSQMSACLASVRVRLRVSRDTARFFRGLEAGLKRHLPRDVSFTELLCVLFWDAWKHLCQRSEAYARVYARDRYTCSSPVCSRHDVTPHHVRFRSRGGSDDDENVAALCTWCHLEGVHGGRIEVTGKVGELCWQLGGLEVKGRQLWREPRQGDCATVA